MSDERKPNDRSDAALRERLKIAGKATPGSWSLQDKGAIPLVYGPNGERVAKAVDNLEDTAHIAASSPDVVKADIAEILRLRAENERLNKEADWLAESLDIITRFCAPEVINDLKYKSWRKAARKAVEEKELYG